MRKNKTRYYVGCIYSDDQLDDIQGPFDTVKDAVESAEQRVADGDCGEDQEFVVLAASGEKFMFEKPRVSNLEMHKAPFA